MEENEEEVKEVLREEQREVKRGRPPGLSKEPKVKRYASERQRKLDQYAPEIHIKRKPATKEDKENAIMLLQKNNYNTKYVSTVTGIRKDTIEYWLEEYRGMMKNAILKPDQLQVMVAVGELGDEYESQQEKFRKALHLTKFSVVERMLQIIPTETNLRYLSEVLEVIGEIERNDNTIVGQSLNGKKAGGTIFQLIQNQIMTVAGKEASDETKQLGQGV
jgi:hypothetical protein